MGSLEFMVLLLVFGLNTFWSLLNFKNKKYLLQVVSGIVSITVSAFFAWTIGPLMLAIGVIQLFIGAMNSRPSKTF
ncbi:hypothetical protein [Aquibacillus salsiterrae]|uniref:Uncharacterized protein n=1 Tax=Aquibacillus salsiterrae TaxID=2950439 RepID=A0A9X4AFZ8_9BACI|nr:hypothetical protein [Aquibacillus salsiterrae]MDC3416558.1 hypothetical protein [Aquibacillus salsiterrae]